MAEDQTTPRRHGCFAYGCLTGLVLLVVIAVGALLGLRYARKMFYQITDDHSMPLPAVQMAPAQLDQVRERVETFKKNVRMEKPTPPLALSADEINALFATDPDVQALRGKLYVTTIENDRVRAQVSLALAEVGLPVFRGRYINGTAIFLLTLRKGLLHLRAQSIVVKGKPLPRIYMEKIRRQNLADNLNAERRASVALNHLQDIQLKDGQLILVPKNP